MLKIKVEDHTLEFVVIEDEDKDLPEEAAAVFARSVLAARGETDDWTFDGTLRDNHDRVRVFFVR